jgi:hypothetical protein
VKIESYERPDHTPLLNGAAAVGRRFGSSLLNGDVLFWRRFEGSGEVNLSVGLFERMKGETLMRQRAHPTIR